MKNQGVRLREARTQDLEFIVQAEHQVENRQYILGWSIERHTEALGNPSIIQLVIEAALFKQAVGFVVLIRHPEHECVEFRRIVITEKGKGYGRAAVGLIKELAFDEWNVHRLWLDVMEHNERARRLYESEGFMIEGRLRECLKQGGTFRSLIIMSLLAHEYHAGGATGSSHRRWRNGPSN
jgi:RimJ/RimL family protein N-acetyltransferase